MYRQIKHYSLLLLLPIIFYTACEVATASGVKKDFNTGLTTTYSGMEPEKVFLVMNDEVIGHTDIPLGEKFTIINDKLKGLKEKDGKVSVGCSLLVADKDGNKVMEEADLFAGNDLFNAKEVTYLKCGVSTGKPMDYDESYFVTVKFWDKYGKGHDRSSCPFCV